MPWKRVAPRRYERPLDNIEQLLKYVTDAFIESGREHWAVNIVARLQFRDLRENQIVEALRRAWIQTRYSHPFIATTIDQNSHHVYDIPTEQDLEHWVSNSFVVHRDETVNHFLQTALMAKYSSLHYFPTSSEILMRTHHWQVDGIGAIHLLDCFLDIFARGDELPTAFGEEWSRLSPSHAEAAPLPSVQMPDDKCAASKLAQENPLAGVRSIGLNFKACPPGETRNTTLVISNPARDAFVASCKAAGFSVTSAIHAAMIVATQEMAANTDQASNFTSAAFFNHRPYLTEPYNNTRAWPMGLFMLSFPISYPHAEFATHAHALQKVYKQPIGLDDCPALRYYDAYIGLLVDLMRQPAPPNALPLASPQLSSIGVVDDRVQHSYAGRQPITVDHVAPYLDVLTVPFLVFQWSWRGRSYINVNYNKNYYKDGLAEEYLARVRDHLGSELGVDLST